MKKYGIKIVEKDNTIGFKDRSEKNEWYANEIERDAAYESYTRKRKSSPSDMLIEMDIANSPYIDGHEVITTTYIKIEEDN